MGSNADKVYAAMKSIDDGRFGDLEALVTADFTLTMGDFRLQGCAGFKAVMDAFKVPFPDLRHEIQSFVEQGDRVATQNLISATHSGEFVSELGRFPATGRPVSWTSSTFVTFENGRAKTWVVYLDTMAIHRAIGFDPASRS